ncbi:bacillithiol biosynthesis cysteine-adding enzyme BshC [Paenibacillus caui]|uniref:bacillithiol biosynthesis cysteine-adding enzyme BshC n=1 Tax=Paenibacillus caui TaxID=2873927 RepID=UPI001CA89B9D|nr:bacillithiol biosynthesis cysteine-adding enzyme BshC [Paenibacillus caui]
MNVVNNPLSSRQPLAAALTADFARVGHLYESDAADQASWSARAAWLDETEKSRLDRKSLVQILRNYNNRYNSYPQVADSLNRLEQTGTVAIVGGQQSGLFTGPLLVIYKAATIILAAKKAEAELGRPVVPVFWIAGEDHDWDEVNHTYVLSRDLKVTRIRLHREDDLRTPVGCTKVEEEEWNRVIQELDELLPDTEFKPQLINQLQSSSGGTLTASFATLIGNLFGRFGLILLDSSDPELRRLEKPVFEELVKRNDELTACYMEAAREVRQLGLETQADVAEDGANLFYIHEGERLLLFKHEDRYADRKGRVSFSKDELIQLAAKCPERFSNNVLTRPLMQEALLPVLGFVLGDGEIAYWGLLKKAFGVLGFKMPILLPRMSFTVVEGTLQKYMDKFGLSFEDVEERYQERREAWLAEQDSLHLDTRFDEVKAAFGSMYEPLVEQLGTIQNGLLKLGTSNKEKIYDQIEYLRDKAKDALAKSNEASLRHWDRIYLSLQPHGKLQERVYNVFYYLNRYGQDDWIDQIMSIPYETNGGHRLILL